MAFRERAAHRVDETLASANAAWSYCLSPKRLLPGNQFRLLKDGDQTFPAIFEAISQARHSVHVETYILDSDQVGEEFARVLISKAQEGIPVRLMFDGFGSFWMDPRFVDSLREGGVDVLEYRPLTPRRRLRRLLRRDHRKIIVVDGQIGFTGGINISRDYIAKAGGGKGWRDTHVRIEGPCVAMLEELFRSVWLSEGGTWYSPGEGTEASQNRRSPCIDEIVSGGWAQVVGTGKGHPRRAIRRHQLHAMKHAKHSIDVANAYFVPDPATCRAFIRAVKRGVRVRLILPGRSDIWSVQVAGENTYAKLLKAGVEIHLWCESHMHAKTMVIDSLWSSVGSYNLDYVSLLLNLEAMVEIPDANFGRLMTDMFEQDLERCMQLASNVWSKRPLLRRLLSRLFYHFRSWL